jgi:hypothetical protein
MQYIIHATYIPHFYDVPRSGSALHDACNKPICSLHVTLRRHSLCPPTSSAEHKQYKSLLSNVPYSFMFIRAKYFLKRDQEPLNDVSYVNWMFNR